MRKCSRIFTDCSKELNFIPKSYDLFIQLQDLIHGKNISGLVLDISDSDSFGNVLLALLNAFSLFTGDYKSFAELIYKVKIEAKKKYLYQVELFADLLIGYSYMELGSYKKLRRLFIKLLKQQMKKA